MERTLDEKSTFPPSFSFFAFMIYDFFLSVGSFLAIFIPSFRSAITRPHSDRKKCDLPSESMGAMKLSIAPIRNRKHYSPKGGNFLFLHPLSNNNYSNSKRGNKERLCRFQSYMVRRKRQLRDILGPHYFIS